MNPEMEASATYSPRHIAVIMDGNGRWAKQRHLPRILGHRKGAETLYDIIAECIEIGVSYLTLYAFSMENWHRPVSEVNALMELLDHYLDKEVQSLHEKNIRLRVIGNVEHFSPSIIKKIQDAEALTANNTALQVAIALSYGARQELLQAARKLAIQVADGALSPDDLNEEALVDALFTSNMPDPDLLIRTGGDQRVSNFLLWQIAYTELYFTDTLWPDFTPACLREAVADFLQRERRFGRTVEDENKDSSTDVMPQLIRRNASHG